MTEVKKTMAKKIYDGIFIFDPTVKEEAIQTLVERVKTEITRMEGEIVDVEIMGKRVFARPQSKKDSGVFVGVRFLLDPAQGIPLRDRYRLHDNLLRTQILRVDEKKQERLAEQARKHAESLAAMEEKERETR